FSVMESVLPAHNGSTLVIPRLCALHASVTSWSSPAMLSLPTTMAVCLRPQRILTTCFGSRTKSGNENGIRLRRSKVDVRSGNSWSLRSIWRSAQRIRVTPFANTCAKSAAQSRNNQIARVPRHARLLAKIFRSSPEQLLEEVVCEIVRLKLAHLSWGPRKIRELYLRGHGEVASESTFKRVLERVGLTQKRRQRRRWTEAGRLSSGKRAAAPNEVWTVDFKGWWRSWGKRCEPLTVRDEHSRYVLELRVMESAGTEKVRQSFERLFERA